MWRAVSRQAQVCIAFPAVFMLESCQLCAKEDRNDLFIYKSCIISKQFFFFFKYHENRLPKKYSIVNQEGEEILGKHAGKRPLGRPRRRSEDNIRKDIK